MRSQWWLLGLAGVAFLLVAAPLYVGVTVAVGQLYAGPVAFSLGWAVHRVVAGRQRDGEGVIYHACRSTRARLADYVVVAVFTVPVGVTVAALSDLAVGRFLTRDILVEDPILLSEPVAMLATLLVSGIVYRHRRPDYEDKTTERTPTSE